MGRLRDKIVLVTGAAGAIGSATADAIVEAGGIAITTDLGGSAGMDHALDVTSEADWLRVVAEIERAAERLDGLVNAAGIAAIGSVEDTDLSTWRRVIAVNLDGTFLGCKHALPLLKRSGGAIVNLSSVSGLVGGHNLAAYNASKGGVRLLTKSVALHGARFDPKVRCNSVHPAFIEGPMADALIAQTKDPRAGAGADEPRRSARPLRQGDRGRGSVRLSVVRRIRLRHRSRVRARRRPDRALMCSVILRALADPCPDHIAVARGKLFLAVRHAQFRRRAPVEQPHQVAAVGIAGNDHLAEFGAGREGQAHCGNALRMPSISASPSSGFSTIGTPASAARWRTDGLGWLVIRMAGAAKRRSRSRWSISSPFISGK